MSYMSNKTRWRFEVPQAGEVDSAESVEERMIEIDKALIGPMAKAELTSNGKKLNPNSFVDGDESKYSDEPDSYWSTIEGRPIYTTKTHFHPLPSVVMRSNQAANATYADSAKRADVAGSIRPGITLNGLKLTGENAQSATLLIDDIPDASRVFFGTGKPSSIAMASPRRGDIYVQIL